MLLGLQIYARYRHLVLALTLCIVCPRVSGGDGDLLVEFDAPDNSLYSVLELPDKSVLLGTGWGAYRFSSNGVVMGRVAQGSSQLLLVSSNSVLVAVPGALQLVDFTGTIVQSVEVDGQVFAMAKQPDGRIVLGGRFTVVNGKARPYLARLMPDLSLDDSFRPPAMLGGERRINYLALQSDGSIVVAGDFLYIGEKFQRSIARFKKTGEFDPDYVPLGASGTISWIGMYADHIFIRPATRTPGYAATMYSPDGRTVTGILTNTEITAIGIQPDGKILAAGKFLNSYGQYRTERLVRLSRDGAYDPTFVYSMGGQPSNIYISDAGSLFVWESGRYFYKLALKLPELRINSSSLSRMNNSLRLPVSTSLRTVVQVEGTTNFLDWTSLSKTEILPPMTEIELPLSQSSQFFRVRTD